MEQPRVVVCMPCYAPITPEAQASLTALIASSPHVSGYLTKALCYVDEARNLLTQEALALEPAPTHLLWLDPDMTWPADTVARLLALDKPVAGGLYFRKAPPHSMVAYRFGNSMATPLDTLPAEPLRVDGLGLGCTLIRTDVLRALKFPGGEPFRKTPSMGEDVYFFAHLHRAGVEVWLEPRVECGHLVTQIVTAAQWHFWHDPDPAQDPNHCDFAGLYREQIERVPDGATLVEVGSYLGGSTVAMAQAIRDAGKRVQFFAVDHFQGSAEPHQQALAARFGGSFRKVFDENLARHRVSHLVQVLEADSLTAATRFADATCDFVFIDADHAELSVRRDIATWLPKVKPGGVLAGHDYDWTTVRRAVDTCLLGVQPWGEHCWIYRKE